MTCKHGREAPKDGERFIFAGAIEVCICCGNPFGVFTLNSVYLCQTCRAGKDA